MTWYEILTAFLSIACIILAGKNSYYNFYLGFLNCAIALVLYLNNHLYLQMLLQLGIAAINFYGIYRWRNPREGEESKGDKRKLRIQGFSKLQMAVFAIALAAIVSAGALLLIQLPKSFPEYFDPDPRPWLDSFTFVAFLVAQILSANKIWQCWIVWIVVNASRIFLHLGSGLFLMAGVSSLFLVISIVSLINWLKLYKNNE